MFAVVLLYLCFTALMFLGCLILSTNHYPFFISGIRFFMSGIILLISYGIHHKKIARDYIQQLWSIAFLKYALCLYTFSAIGFSWGMQYIDPVKACFIFVLAPFVTALLLYFFKNERMSNNKLLGLFIGFASVVPIILEQKHDTTLVVDWYMALLGYIAFSAAVFMFAYGWILNKEMYKTVHAPSSLVTGMALILGGFITFLFAIIFQFHALCTMHVTQDFWWLLLLLSILTAYGYNLYAKLLRRFSATFVSFASFLEPAFGLLYASIFLGQSISNIALVALLGLGCGLYIFYQEELRLH